MEKLIRCRGCPRCGSRLYTKVAQSFGWGTWNECRDCHYNYAPAPSMKTAIPAIVLGACFLTAAVGIVPSAKLDSTVAIFLAAFGIGGLVLVLGGVYAIVRYFRTPKGPLSNTGAFPILPSDRA
jgi:hypothetical protein